MLCGIGISKRILPSFGNALDKDHLKDFINKMPLHILQ